MFAMMDSSVYSGFQKSLRQSVDANGALLPLSIQDGHFVRASVDIMWNPIGVQQGAFA